MFNFNAFLSSLLTLPLVALIFSISLSSDGETLADEDAPAVKSERLDFIVDTLVSSKDMRTPWGMAFLPKGDILVTDRGGELRLIQDGRLHPKPIGGVPEARAKSQGGLLDIELHPQYEQNGWIYMVFSKPMNDGKEGTTALIRAKLKNHELVDLETLFEGKPAVRQAHHYGSKIAFDKKGYIFFSMGDRGERPNAQLLTNHRGKVFRLHDDGRVPADNPFVNQKDAMPEIYSYGHRNPQGLAIHPETDQLWETEHGPKGGDELNLVKKGLNYGWPEITYGINYNGTIITEETKRAGLEQPIMYWLPSIGPCGLTFVNSDRYPNWKGDLLAGSLSFRYLERIDLEGERVIHREKLLEDIGRIRDIQEGRDGYIYVAVEGNPGMIVRLIPVGEGAAEVDANKK